MESPFREVVADVGGETLVLQGNGLENHDEGRLQATWNDARDSEYAELIGVAEKYLAEIDHEFEIEKFTLADASQRATDALARYTEAVYQRTQP